MLKEIRCDAFRTFEGKKREPITFYKGLNVVLGSNVKFIDSGAFRNTRIENMYINSQNPPKLHSLAFDTSWSSVQDSLRILYVPKGTLNAYKSSDWRYYFDGIKEMD